MFDGSRSVRWIGRCSDFFAITPPPSGNRRAARDPRRCGSAKPYGRGKRSSSGSSETRPRPRSGPGASVRRSERRRRRPPAQEPVEGLHAINMDAVPGFLVGTNVLPLAVVDREVRPVLAQMLVGWQAVGHDDRRGIQNTLQGRGDRLAAMCRDEAGEDVAITFGRYQKERAFRASAWRVCAAERLRKFRRSRRRPRGAGCSPPSSPGCDATDARQCCRAGQASR